MKEKNNTRVRFAPSPTGNLHIGGARTALFNWLFAKSKKGAFILRIEDTDQQRSEKKYLDEILNSLKWIGLDWDEVYYQSKRFDIYREYALKLVKEEKAYFAKKQDTDSNKPTDQNDESKEAIILRVSAGKIKVNDLIRGEIEFDASTIKDQVLIKSDGSPAYNFACVMDDTLMNISHVIRGDDHISNTPKQILIYEALGFKPPLFAHLPLILGKDGRRLSKRTGATAISQYKDMGYLPNALVNFLMLLGWSLGNNQEIVGLAQAVKKFSIRSVNKAACTFDVDKLNWMNGKYIKASDPNDLVDFIRDALTRKGLIKKDNFSRDYLISLIKLYQSRMNTLLDFVDRADFFFLDNIEIDQELKNKVLSRDFSKEFSLLIERLERLTDYSYEAIEKSFRELVSQLNLKAKDLVHPVRLVLTGKTVGAGLFETMALLGLDKTRSRLKRHCSN